MVLEISTIEVRADSEDAFAAAYRQARPILTGTPGCRSVRLTRGIESPSRFYLLVEWDSLESHEHGFRRTDRLPRWRELLEQYYASPPVVEHATDVPSAPSRR
jgi:heme-degrading monooxygenase HmoA